MKEKIALLASAFLFVGCVTGRHLPTDPHDQVILWATEIGIKKSSISSASVDCTSTDANRNTSCSIKYLLGEGLYSGRTYYATELLLCHEKRGCQKIPVDEYGHLYLISEEQ